MSDAAPVHGPVPGFLVHEPVAHFARLTPEAPAMIMGEDVLTWRGLDEASARLASALVEDGLEQQGRVGVFMRKGLELGAAIYGTLRAGGAFVPLDPALPTERLAFILRDCGIEHVVSTDAMGAALASLAALEDGPRPRLYGPSEGHGLETRSWDALSERAAAAPEVWITDQDLAYLMYTSGSTGVPKGMMHTHRGSLSYARWGAGHVGLTAADRVASHAPLHFDLSIFDFFSTSQAGAAVVLVPEAVTKFPASFTELCERDRVSVLFTVPFTLIEMHERGALDRRDLSALRWVLFGGEPYPRKHLARLMAALPHTRFSNVYGPAEAPSCTVYDVPALDPDDDAPLPIGTVSVGSDDLIVDENGDECGVGQPGELCIRSSTLTRGYWNRPDLNERVFLRRPSFGPFEDVWFRTGDMVERRSDGLLDFLGRADRMIKTRGHRVELDEVEAALAAHPSVLEAATFAVPDEGGTRAIAAAVVLEPSAEPADDADLRAWVRGKLPPYAVPRRVDVLASFPRTTSGKIDRRALAAAHP